MDKRMEANRIVKDKIGMSLMHLMSKKNFSDITVTDIITHAKVARASYYRYFSSKEDLIVSLTSDIMENFSNGLEIAGYRYDSKEGILLAFRLFRLYRLFILRVHKAGLASIYQEIFDDYLVRMAGNMKCSDINRYLLYYFSGALYNVFIKWVENGMREDCEQMAMLIYRRGLGPL